MAQAAEKALDSKNPQSAKVILEGLVLGIKLVTSSSYLPADESHLSQGAAVEKLKKIIKSIEPAKVPLKGK